MEYLGVKCGETRPLKDQAEGEEKRVRKRKNSTLSRMEKHYYRFGDHKWRS